MSLPPRRHLRRYWADDLPEVIILRQVWEAQYEQVEGKVLWRKDSCANCSVATHLNNPRGHAVQI
jgi:hypothetical protein